MRYLREIKELNQVEQWKLERHPLDVRDAVLDRYAREGPEAIKTVHGEVERLKWVGLYPQRQGGDAFMLRIKIPGGRLDAAQARVIGEIADEHARGPAPNPVFGDGYLDLTTRQDIQLHWIRIGAVPEIWAAAGGGRHHHRAGLRRLGPQRALLPGLRASTPTRCSTPTRWPRRSPTSSPATASTPTCRASSS